MPALKHSAMISGYRKGDVVAVRGLLGGTQHFLAVAPLLLPLITHFIYSPASFPFPASSSRHVQIFASIISIIPLGTIFKHKYLILDYVVVT